MEARKHNLQQVSHSQQEKGKSVGAALLQTNTLSSHQDAV